MKKRVIKIAALVVLFAAVLVISNVILNRGNDDQVVDMGDATLPRVSFMMGGQKINALSGYVDDMDIAAMRDTITPLESDGTLKMQIEKNDNQIREISYSVYSLDGTKTYDKGTLKSAESEDVTLKLGKSLGDKIQEAVLQVSLVIGEEKETRKVNFYTRIEKADDITASQCLTFAQDFHTKAFNKTDVDSLNIYLEPGDESDNTTYQTVNIHSDISHIQWGTMQPQLLGDVRWSIKESNSVYTSLLANYRVSCVDDAGENAVYDIKEFFRVRIAGTTIYLLDYNRDMQEVFSENRSVIDEDGILLGVTPLDVPYETNEKETIAAFVESRNLWMYNKSCNLAFAVYGYMNRGEHEGEVGVGIYYFDVERNLIQEKAFIPSKKSYAIAADELGKMVYYNHAEEQLYVLADGTLYQVDLKKNKQTTLAENLKEGQYAVSDDGHLMAYQSEGDKRGGTVIQVMNLSSLETNTVEAASGEKISPLGFVNGDFIYGKMKSEDAGKKASGESITPMYELEIRNSKNKKVASYSFVDKGIYISDILIDDNMVTLNRVEKSGDIYNVTSQEFITNNEERKDTAIKTEVYTTALMEKQMRITFAEGAGDKSVKVIRPNQLASKNELEMVLADNSESVKYYVYGVGELAGIYDKASYAIQKAQKISGVVISSDQKYVWEKGNRDLAYSIEDVALSKEGEETSLEACERYMKTYDAQKVDLTGCTLDQVLYVINRGCPVIALTSADHAILLTGYTKNDITYIDPENGESQTVSISEMEGMVSGSGNTFIGYIK